MSPRGHAVAGTRAGRRVHADRITALRAEFGGDVIAPDDPDYETRRLVWNDMIDRHPALIVLPEGAVDVQAAVRFALAEGLEIAVKGGGHGAAGLATVDDGLMIDLGAMRGVRVDPATRGVWVQGGALLVDIDREASPYGVAVPAGVNWDTGVAGLTLGGGYGWLGRMYGLASDCLRSVELVTADARIITASETEDAELFWGLRGGGGNFGIVTWFEFEAKPVPPVVKALDLVFAERDFATVVRVYRDVAARAPRTATGSFAIMDAPAWPGVPGDVVGTPVTIVGFVGMDPGLDLEALLRPVLDAATPIAVVPWQGTHRELQRSSSEPAGTRKRRYWKAYYVTDIPDALIDALTDIPSLDPQRYALIEFVQQGGAIGDLAADATAFAHRDAAWDVLAVGYWTDPSEDEARIAAMRALAAQVEPFSSGVYLNNLLDEGEARVRDAYRDGRFERLRALKTRMDPDNVFHRNANIPPLV